LYHFINKDSLVKEVVLCTNKLDALSFSSYVFFDFNKMLKNLREFLYLLRKQVYSSFRNKLKVFDAPIIYSKLQSDYIVQKETFESALSRLIPYFYGTQLMRMGGDNDGGYLIPDDLNGIAACFSPGLAHTHSFEDALFDLFNIQSFVCDPVKPPSSKLLPNYISFIQKKLAPFRSRKSLTLENWVNSSILHQDQDLLLQIDIEGDEYATLLACDLSTILRFRIIVMELHYLELLPSSVFMGMFFMPLIDRLSSYFDLVHFHANNQVSLVECHGIMIPPVIELTWHRKDRRKTQCATPANIPNIHDRPNNPSRNDFEHRWQWQIPMHEQISS